MISNPYLLQMHILVFNIIFTSQIKSLQVIHLNPQPTTRTPDITPSEPRDHRLICTYPHGNPECQMSLRTSTK